MFTSHSEMNQERTILKRVSNNNEVALNLLNYGHQYGKRRASNRKENRKKNIRNFNTGKINHTQNYVFHSKFSPPYTYVIGICITSKGSDDNTHTHTHEVTIIASKYTNKQLFSVAHEINGSRVLSYKSNLFTLNNTN